MMQKSLMETAFLPQDNTSGQTGTPPPSPTTLLENFIPGYGPIHKFLLYSFGFDVTVLVSLGAARIGHYIWKTLKDIITYCMSEISVSSNDEIHTYLLHFLASHNKTRSSRRLIADTPAKSTWELDSETETLNITVDTDGKTKWLNFSNQEAKTQPRFTPAIGSYIFRYKGTVFLLRRKEVTIFDEIGDSRASTLKDKEILTLSCFGWSTELIKALILDAKADYHRGHNVKTIIKRPSPKDLRRWDGKACWTKIAERPCRPMKTVVINEERRREVLADINEYLHPATAKWYANRGIPYRRGYLLHGPPGTGKTSFTFALAGFFGLDLHVVSLLEPTLTEEELGTLFTYLPPRCIVLLEDIDTAGLMRNDPESDEAKKKTEGDSASTYEYDEGRNKGISLSGLLNIIDGVASHEGRVLIMTTNRPENLDDALIRPGRVDLKVPFGNATQGEAEELFELMYANVLPRTCLPPSGSQNGSTSTQHIEEARHVKKELVSPELPTLNSFIKSNPVPKLLNQVLEEVPGEELGILAKIFAKEVPDGVFPAAELQGFLLKRKNDPRKACDEVQEWVNKMLEVKKICAKLVPEVGNITAIL